MGGRAEAGPVRHAGRAGIEVNRSGRKQRQQSMCDCPPSPRPSPPGEGETCPVALNNQVAGLAGLVDEFPKMCHLKTLSRGRGQGEGGRLNQIF